MTEIKIKKKIKSKKETAAWATCLNLNLLPDLILS